MRQIAMETLNFLLYNYFVIKFKLYAMEDIMGKITFMGAGSTVFAKNVIGDSMLSEALCDFEMALYDIDAERLEESYTCFFCTFWCNSTDYSVIMY